MKDGINILVDQAKQGDKKAFNKLYTKYNRLIRYIIYDIVKDDDLTKDLVSDTFLKAYERLGSYINPISFEAWLKTIAVNTTIDYLRASKDNKKNSSIDDEDNFILLEDDSKDPESNIIDNENLTLLRIALSRLRFKHRNILELRYFKNLSYKELSVMLGVPVGTIKSDLCKARHKLKVQFQKLSEINKL